MQIMLFWTKFVQNSHIDNIAGMTCSTLSTAMFWKDVEAKNSKLSKLKHEVMCSPTSTSFLWCVHYHFSSTIKKKKISVCKPANILCPFDGLIPDLLRPDPFQREA